MKYFRLIPVVIVIYIIAVFTYPAFKTNSFSDELNYLGKKIFLPQVNLFTFFEDRFWALNKLEVVGINSEGGKVSVYRPPKVYIWGLSRDLALFSLFFNLTRMKEIPSETKINEFLKGKLSVPNVKSKTRLLEREFNTTYNKRDDLMRFLKHRCKGKILESFISLCFINRTGIKVERKVSLGEIVCE